MKSYPSRGTLRRAAAGLVLGGFLALPAAGVEQTLNMTPATEVRGPHILLADLVRDRGSLPAGWGERVVFPAPAPGKTETYPISSIAYALQQYPDMHQVILRGTPNTAVRRAVMTLEGQEISQAIDNYVLTHDPWKSTPVQIVPGAIGRITGLPTGKLELSVAGYREARGSLADYTFDVDVLVDGGVVRSLQVPVKVSTLREVWVAARTLDRGHRLVEGDLQIRPLAWQSGESAMVSARDDLNDQELARDVRIGQPILRNYLNQPVCAKTGDLIAVTAASGGLSVTLQAKAMAGGRRGDVIQCMNENSKRRLLVRLTGLKTATLDVPEFSQKE